MREAAVPWSPLFGPIHLLVALELAQSQRSTTRRCARGMWPRGLGSNPCHFTSCSLPERVSRVRPLVSHFYPGLSCPFLATLHLSAYFHLAFLSSHWSPLDICKFYSIDLCFNCDICSPTWTLPPVIIHVSHKNACHDEGVRRPLFCSPTPVALLVSHNANFVAILL